MNAIIVAPRSTKAKIPTASSQMARSVIANPQQCNDVPGQRTRSRIDPSAVEKNGNIACIERGNPSILIAVSSVTLAGVVVMKAWNSRVLLFALAVSSPIALGGVGVVSFAPGSAEARLADPNVRIDAAFSLLSNGKHQGAPADCGKATWPNIAPACLVRADGSPAQDVRVVRIAY
jgi:hypothetical protein